MSHENRLAITETIRAIAGLGLIAVGLIELSRYQFPKKARLEVVKSVDRCEICGRDNPYDQKNADKKKKTKGRGRGRKSKNGSRDPNQGFEAHHRCHEAIAGKYLPKYLVHHPANGVKLCSECHLQYHLQYPNESFSYEDELKMVQELLESILYFHRTHRNELEELHTSHVLLEHPTKIFNEAEKTLRQVKRELKKIAAENEEKSRRDSSINYPHVLPVQYGATDK